VCNLYSITTNQAAIIALFRVMNQYVGNLPPMPGVFPDYPAPVVSNAAGEREIVMMRWGMPPPPRAGGYPVTNIRKHVVAALAGLAQAREPLSGPGEQLRGIRTRDEPRHQKEGRRVVRPE
jgi:putative SOS response-associated peptidase YedK